MVRIGPTKPRNDLSRRERAALRQLEKDFNKVLDRTPEPHYTAGDVIAVRGSQPTALRNEREVRIANAVRDLVIEEFDAPFVATTTQKFAVTCEYGHGGAVTHLVDHEGRPIGSSFRAADEFASVQSGDRTCVAAYVVVAGRSYTNQKESRNA